MKRALGLLFVGAALVAAFLTVRGAMPFLPIFGTSMEPAFHTGGLLLIQPVNPNDIKVGDVIVFNVAPAIREHYNYPPVVAHRVVKVTDDHRGRSFRTKGDNTGEDPFTIMPQDLRGTVGKQIPYIGFPLLFMQSKQGMIFVVIALALLTLYLYGGELDWGRRRVQKGIFSPVLEESQRNNQVLSRKIEVTEKRMDTTQQALEKFASAIELYAQHLASHTSAIQGLSQASHELSKSAAQQNQVLAHIMDVVEKSKTTKETPPVADIEKLLDQLQKSSPELPKVTPEPPSVTAAPQKKQYPPGCYRCRRDNN